MQNRPTTKLLERLAFDDDYLIYWLQAGYTKRYRRVIRHRLDNKKMTRSLMEEILQKLGCIQVQPAIEATWKLPDDYLK